MLITVYTGTMKDVRFKIAISVPPSWYGKVQASAFGLFNLEPEPRPEVQLLPEPISCLTYFLSRNKKHPLGNGGLMCHCSMDESFTVRNSAPKLPFLPGFELPERTMLTRQRPSPKSWSRGTILPSVHVFRRWTFRTLA